MTNSSPWFFDGPNRNRWFTYEKHLKMVDLSSSLCQLVPSSFSWHSGLKFATPALVRWFCRHRLHRLGCHEMPMFCRERWVRLTPKILRMKASSTTTPAVTANQAFFFGSKSIRCLETNDVTLIISVISDNYTWYYVILIVIQNSFWSRYPLVI